MSQPCPHSTSTSEILKDHCLDITIAMRNHDSSPPLSSASITHTSSLRYVGAKHCAIATMPLSVQSGKALCCGSPKNEHRHHNNHTAYIHWLFDHFFYFLCIVLPPYQLNEYVSTIAINVSSPLISFECFC